MTEQLEVNAIKCTLCNDIIYSRAVHDFHCCSCESVCIDGGFDYTKISGEPENVQSTSLTLDANMAELYNDWRWGEDEFGWIHPKENNES